MTLATLPTVEVGDTVVVTIEGTITYTHGDGFHLVATRLADGNIATPLYYDELDSIEVLSKGGE